MGGADMRNNIIWYLSLYTLVPFVSWIFHGNSRVWEQKLQFRTETVYKMYLFQAVTSFGIPWHTDHHSGETIDKIAKAVSGLHDFSGNMFMYLGTFVSLIGSFIALILIWPLAALILPIMAAAIFLIIWRFDIRIVDLIKQRNKKEHKVTSLVYDYLSNIKTIITLRFVERTWTVVRDKIQETYPLFKRQVLTNEWKWFIVNMILALTIGIMVGWYAHIQIAAT